jgi:hypothetical protein
MATILPSSSIALNFRVLSSEHAQKCYELEKDCIDRHPKLVKRGEIHPKSLEEYTAYLQAQSPYTFIGAFDGDRMVAFGAHIIPERVQDLRAYEYVQIERNNSYRLAALALCDRGPTAMNLFLRVHPDMEGHHVGRELVMSRLATLMNIDAPGRIIQDSAANGIDVPLVMTNITATKLSAIFVQLASTITTPLIWSAGYEVDGKSNPPTIYIAHVHPDLISYKDLPVKFHRGVVEIFGDKNQNPGPKFDCFANILDHGFVAWRNFHSPDLINFAERPAAITAYTAG